MAQWNNVYNSNPGGVNGTTGGLTVPTIITGPNNINEVLTITAPGVAKFLPPAAPAADALSAVLAVGNTTGANNLVVSNGQSLIFNTGSGVRISGNGTTISTAPNASGIAIGNATTNASGTTGPVAIGIGAVATGLAAVAVGNAASGTNTGNIAIGASATVSGTGSMTLGYQSSSTGNQTTVVGMASNGGSGLNNTVIGASSLANTTAANCTIVGRGSSVSTGSSFATLVGNAIGASPAVVSNLVAIGTQGNIQGSNTVKIGRGAFGTGSDYTCVGDNITITGTSSRGVAIGQGFTIPALCNDSVVIGYQPTITGTPSNSLSIGTSNVLGFSGVCAVGNGAGGGAIGMTSFGTNANLGASGANGTAIGNSATVGTGAGNTVLGNTATCGASSNNVVIGLTATSSGSTSGNVVVGQAGSVIGTATDCIAVGRAASINGAFTGCTAIGAGAVGAASNAVYLRTGLTTVAAVTAVNYDTATGRLFPVTSSIRYKQNVQDFDVMHDVLQIKPKMYSFKKGHCGCGNEECDGLQCGRREIGYIAEDMEQIFPEICSYSRDAEGNRQVESIQYERLVLLLIPEVKRLRDRIEALEAAQP